MDAADVLVVDDATLARSCLVEVVRGSPCVGTVRECAPRPDPLAAGLPDLLVVRPAADPLAARRLLALWAGAPLVLLVDDAVDEPGATARPTDGPWVRVLGTHADADDLRAAVCAALGHRSAPAVAPTHLTPREREVMRLLGDGLTNREIARLLVLEERTVKNHVHNLLRKLGVRHRGEAAALLDGAAVPPVAHLHAVAHHR